MFSQHLSQVEVLGLLPRDPGLRTAPASVLPEGGEGLVAVFEGVPDSAVDAETARVVGSFYQALLTGLMVQSLITPGSVPSGGDLVEAMRRVLSRSVLGPRAGPAEGEGGATGEESAGGRAGRSRTGVDRPVPVGTRVRPHRVRPWWSTGR
ncbi:hypothetical protein [Streptomyces sp. NRRL F-5755]|uniref:hypothetical protein n=1 Tax=Streptomyces sp. NRRL F-5755 TaxID=1519475 RepID=UPI0006ADA4C9|nr:hypothetical protein [Streptomyces sp. NRRL F-5755]